MNIIQALLCVLLSIFGKTFKYHGFLGTGMCVHMRHTQVFSWGWNDLLHTRANDMHCLTFSSSWWGVESCLRTAKWFIISVWRSDTHTHFPSDLMKPQALFPHLRPALPLQVFGQLILWWGRTLKSWPSDWLIHRGNVQIWRSSWAGMQYLWPVFNLNYLPEWGQSSGVSAASWVENWRRFPWWLLTGLLDRNHCFSNETSDVD